MKADLDRKTDPPTMGCGSHAAVGMAVRHWMIPDVRGRVVPAGEPGRLTRPHDNGLAIARLTPVYLGLDLRGWNPA